VSKKASLTILFLMFAGFFMPGSYLASAQVRQKQVKKTDVYACPMHPEVISKRPGKCPKCGMTLRLRKGGDATATAAATSDTSSLGEIATVYSEHIPDVQIYDQTGRKLNFYSDLIKGKTVAINFIFTTCTGICPPLTATFRRVQQELSEQKLPVQLVSISVDPATDTPARLLEFSAKFKAGPGWTFVTGDKAAIDSILQALGAAVANKNDHTPMILIGNDARDYWTRVYGLSPSTVLLKVIGEAAGSK
jgi:cytochrome oxidase Cu insertion factor (SCO1/SenC/PrrC family)